MRVLHLPYNVASQIKISVQALRGIGVKARGLVSSDSVIQSNAELESCEGAFSDRPRFSPRWFRDRISSNILVLRAIRWADLLHYHFGGEFSLPGQRDLK